MGKFWQLSVTMTVLSLCLLACGKPQVLNYDHAAEPLPFERPQLELAETFPQTGALPPALTQQLIWQRAFFRSDFGQLDEALNASHRAFIAGESPETVLDRLAEALKSTQLAGVDACNDWLIAKPSSYAAHYVCASMWHNAAWAARGGEYASKVTRIRFTLMEERLRRSNALLEQALTLSPKPVEALVLKGLNQRLLGDKAALEPLLLQAEKIMPGYWQIHAVRINYALPEWDGSTEEVKAAWDKARAAGLQEDLLLDYHDQYVVRPNKISTPGAERAYWEKVLAEKVTYGRQMLQLQYFSRMQNWPEVIAAASRLIERQPDNGYAYGQRAEAEEKLGNTLAAQSDYREAAARGDDHAMQTLIRASITGGLGLPAKNWHELLTICQYGAALGRASAANCIASMFWEGDAVGEPFKTNIPQAFAWHLVAARAGYHNSQFDLGWLMLSGRAPNVNTEQGQRDGLFWLRRAAAQEHEYAKNKLREGGHHLEEIADK